MEYFYTPPHLIGRSELTIEGDEFVHLTHVMRKKPGDAIRVVNGVGTAYDATIVGIDRRIARCEITVAHPRLHEPERDLTLGAAILKNSSRFDFLVEKVTELGVNTIVPLLTERTIPRHAKTDRWQKLALAAMKQSGRCILPRVRESTSLSAFLDAATPGTLRLIPHEQGDFPALMDIIRGREFRSALICIGPEGGFADDELKHAQHAGFEPVSLGQRRLRTETACVVAMGLLSCP